jgi:ribonuclease BN (tRNA processing enzyme)
MAGVDIGISEGVLTMQTLRVTFLGSGDAFGSGGRLQTCFLVTAPSSRFLVDCGTSVMISMRRFGINPNDVEKILISHLHGDHFGGIPFFVLDAQLINKRTRPLLIAGPPGLEKRVMEAMEVMFPGSSRAKRPFALKMVELEPERPHVLGDTTVTAFVVEHPCGDPPLALRIECGGKSIAYSGDTEWVPSLATAARGVDLFIAEAYFFAKKVKFHLDYQTLCEHLEDIRMKRLVVTHMSEDMLAKVGALPCECADDGKTIIV